MWGCLHHESSGPLIFPYIPDKGSQALLNHIFYGSLANQYHSGTILGYVNGTIKCPNADADPENYYNWKSNDDIAVGAIMQSIESSETDDIDPDIDTSYDIFTKLKAKEGPIKQANLLVDAFSTRISRTDKNIN